MVSAQPNIVSLPWLIALVCEGVPFGKWCIYGEITPYVQHYSSDPAPVLPTVIF